MVLPSTFVQRPRASWPSSVSGSLCAFAPSSYMSAIRRQGPEPQRLKIQMGSGEE